MNTSDQAHCSLAEQPADPLTVFVISWGRPIYLWACLDALYRQTLSPARVVLLDNANPDPLVKDVIAGFERRGMFDEVVRFKTNSFNNIVRAYQERLEGLGPLHVYLESDCVIEATRGCWLANMQRIMENNSRIGMLGSLIDGSEFVPPEVALRLTGGNVEKAEFLAKGLSPERKLQGDASCMDGPEDYIVTEPPFPFSSPPGRLMMLRTDIMQQVGFHVDIVLGGMLKERGMLLALARHVRHRHLSLLNIYDYPDYDERCRNDFFSSQLTSSE